MCMCIESHGYHSGKFFYAKLSIKVLSILSLLFIIIYRIVRTNSRGTILVSEEKVNWSLLAIGKSFTSQIATLRSSLGILSPPKRMIVTILAGRNLASRDRNGKSDPYCVLNYEGQEYKTKRRNSTLNPVWKNQFFSL